MTKNRIAIRRQSEGKIQTLVEKNVAIPRGRMIRFDARCDDEEITFSVGDEKIIATDPSPLAHGRFGVLARGGSITFDGLTLETAGQSFRMADVDPQRSKFLGPAEATEPSSAASSTANNTSPEGDAEPPPAGIVLAPDPDRAQRRAFVDFCELLLNLNEFVYID